MSRRAARTLFHGTLRAWEHSLRADGLRPMIGATVRSAYDIGAGARPLVFAAASPEETRAAIISQIVAATGKNASRVTRDDVARLGMIVEVSARGFIRARAGTEGHPAFVEDEDWYTDQTVFPSGFWTAEMMRDFADGRRVTPIGDGRAAARENPRPRTAQERTDPLLWEHAKREAVRRLGGRHSARAMQLAGRLYREAGGGYRGPRTTAQRSLARWTTEAWTTATGEKACRTTRQGVRCDRYLPRAAWAMLSPAEAAATRRTKLRASKQYVPNEPAARAAGKRARRSR